MQDSIGPEHRSHRNLQEILSASRRAADLSRQLLAFGRKQMQSLRVLDLDEILRDISKMLARLVGEDIDLVLVPGSDLGKVKLDSHPGRARCDEPRRQRSRPHARRRQTDH